MRFRQLAAAILTALIMLACGAEAAAQQEFRRKIEQVSFVPKGAFLLSIYSIAGLFTCP